jgi:hypothetical protein
MKTVFIRTIISINLSLDIPRKNRKNRMLPKANKISYIKKLKENIACNFMLTN